MKYDFSPFTKRVQEIEAFVSKELGGIRTSRATPALLDGVRVEAYGSRMTLSQLASISTEGSQTLRVAPWDIAVLKDIEKAIIAANLGVSVAVDDRGVRLSFPALTEERRKSLLKGVNEKVEVGRVSLRRLRDEFVRDIDAKEKGKEISKDEQFRFKNELQKLVDAANKTLSEISARKEKEILEK